MPPHLAGAITYQPPLPRRRNQLTDRTPMGTTVKVRAAPNNRAGACLLLRAAPRFAVSASVCQAHQARGHSRRGWCGAACAPVLHSMRSASAPGQGQGSWTACELHS